MGVVADAGSVTVGRRRELDVLETLLALVVDGRGAVLLLSGEAGIGKSHLLAELSLQAKSRGFGVAIGRCFSDATHHVFAPWREALGDVTLASSSRPRLGAQEDRVRSFEQVLKSIRELASTRPLLVAIEDLHWADRDSLQLFLQVARFGLSAAVLLVGTVRTLDLDAERNDALDAVLARPHGGPPFRVCSARR